MTRARSNYRKHAAATRPTRYGRGQARGPPTLAKLTRPRLFAVTARERLFALLDARLAHPIVWISGPPGAGKTTLVSGYIDSRKRPALWYQLDGGDADVATFFHYLGIAAEGFDRGRPPPPLPALTPEYLPDLPGFTRRFFRELFARMPRSSLLVLDDYHEVPRESALHAVVACALAELPEGAACVVVSRGESPPECARLVAHQSIAALEWNDLRLTDDEAVAIARARKIVDETAVLTARARSDGWVAGLILLLGQAPATAAASIAPTSKSLFNYFSDIFANTLPAETRELLQSVALLPSVTGPVAVRLSGNERAELLLQDLNERNLFVLRRSEDAPTYRFHTLFHDFLRELVDRSSTSAELSDQLRRTADALADAGDDEQAVLYYGKAGDWTRASDIVVGLAPRLLMQGRWQTLQNRIAAFPPEWMAQQPWLRYWLGASQMAVDPKTAYATMASAYEDFVRAGDAEGRMLCAATAIECQFVLWADFSSLDRWIGELEDLFAGGVQLPNPEAEIRGLANLVHALTFRVSSLPKMKAYVQRLLELAEGDATPGSRLVAATTLTYRFAWLADADNLPRASTAMRSLLARTEILPVQLAYAITTLAYAAYTRADPDDSDALFARAFALARTHGLSYLESWLPMAECWHRLDRGEYRAVGAALTKLEGALALGRGMDVAHFYLVRGWLALLEENFSLARQNLETAGELASRAGANYTESFHVLLLAEALIGLEDFAGASDCVARYRARFGALDSPVFEFNALLVDAYAAFRQGSAHTCAAALGRAFAIGRTHGYVTTRNWHARMMSRLCAFAIEHGVEAEYARMLIVRRRLTPDVPIESWPWPVKVYTLGAFEVRIDGEALHFAGKVQRRPIALLKVLAAHGGDVATDKLIDMLWPEPSEGDGQKALEITVHRLRKLLGSDEAVHVTDRHVTLNPKFVWVDAWALERTLAPLVAAASAPEPEIGLLNKAAPDVLRLYRGHFLAGDSEEHWQIGVRDRLAGRFQRFALRLGECWESQAHWQRALDLYRRVVDLDPLAESFYRRQMICLEAQGQRAEAIEVFRHCRQALSVTLGVAPSAETEAVHRRLLASG